ncbi:MAG: phytase [Saprospiraceae bacterium]|nr:phytase [Saprospiraceae bacterium]
MQQTSILIGAISTWLCLVDCSGSRQRVNQQTILQPEVITQKVLDDSDDPAIWVDAKNPENSIILGTDKHPVNGGVYVFRLDGSIDRNRTRLGLKRPNNVDVAYGMKYRNGMVDIAVATERDRNCLRIYQLPDMTPIDNGGIPIAEQAADSLPMGIALYKAPDQTIYAVVSRKEGPARDYLSQYAIEEENEGKLRVRQVRRFGAFSGKKEVEAICVDSELGYIYYSDERAGIRKYHADPAKGNQELAFFGQGQYKVDNEGISVVRTEAGKGYLLVSNQAANSFIIYPREGTAGNPHNHPKLAEVPVAARDSDGSESWSSPLPGFEGGLFVAMSTDKTFHFYSLKKLLERAGLKR